MKYPLAIMFGIGSLISFVDYFKGVAPSEISNIIIGLLFLKLTIEYLTEKK